jgi:ribosomal protein S18 acetylase RimI-like enzyme
MTSEHAADIERDYTIVRARATDAPAIQQCLHNAFSPFRVAYTAEAFQDTVPSIAIIRDRIDGGVVLLALRLEDARLMGALTAFVHGDHAHLRGMAVDPAFQGKGIARALLTEMERLLSSKGVLQITLEVTAPLRRAVSVYLAAGYRRTGRETAYFGMTLYEYRKKLLDSRS